MEAVRNDRVFPLREERVYRGRELIFISAVPDGMGLVVGWLPGVETPGYYQASRWDAALVRREKLIAEGAEDGR